jgi:hypothetical protein
MEAEVATQEASAAGDLPPSLCETIYSTVSVIKAIIEGRETSVALGGVRQVDLSRYSFKTDNFDRKDFRVDVTLANETVMTCALYRDGKPAPPNNKEGKAHVAEHVAADLVLFKQHQNLPELACLENNDDGKFSTRARIFLFTTFAVNDQLYMDDLEFRERVTKSASKFEVVKVRGSYGAMTGKCQQRT